MPAVCAGTTTVAVCDPHHAVPVAVASLSIRSSWSVATVAVVASLVVRPQPSSGAPVVQSSGLFITIVYATPGCRPPPHSSGAAPPFAASVSVEVK